MAGEASSYRRSNDLHHVHYVALGRDRRFTRLHKRFAYFSLAILAVFFAWYSLYVAMSAFGRNFMNHRLTGNINVGLVFGVLEFASTFAFAWFYAHYAKTSLDPLADRIRDEIDAAIGAPLALRSGRRPELAQPAARPQATRPSARPERKSARW
ncbi:MAG: hypothetical protein JWL58_718 [Streptosporangiaceae bacterium]|nr:hypothetical protein [Streptosporangiaceae bacterium]